MLMCQKCHGCKSIQLCPESFGSALVDTPCTLKMNFTIIFLQIILAKSDYYSEVNMFTKSIHNLKVSAIEKVSTPVGCGLIV